MIKKGYVSHLVSISHYEMPSGAPNDSFLSDPLKHYFRLSREPLKLYRFILGSAICSVILGELESFRN